MITFKRFLLENYLLTEAAKMTSIKHIHQLTPKEFLEIFKDESVFELTEKMDGSNWGCGVENGEIFVKTKRGKPVTSPAEFYATAAKLDSEIFTGFGRSLEMLQKARFKNWYYGFKIYENR